MSTGDPICQMCGNLKINCICSAILKNIINHPSDNFGMKNLKVEKASKYSKSKELLLPTLANKEVIEKSGLLLDLSDSLLNKIDLFLSNTNLDKKQQAALLQIMVETHGEGYENCMTE